MKDGEIAMAGAEVFDALGLDPESWDVQEALDDARVVLRLIDELVGLRDEMGLTQADVAEAMGTTQSSVSKFERAGGDPRISTIQRYARAIGAKFHARVSIDGGHRWQPLAEVAMTYEPEPERGETEPIWPVQRIKSAIA